MLSVAFLIFLFGLIIGSFLNVLIIRIPDGKSIRGRSQCMACQKRLRWFELIPLFSYVILRGKCRSCRVGISLQYPIVELATALLFLATYYFNTSPFQHLNILILFRDWFFIAVLLILFVQDLRFQILPDIITLPAIVLALIFNTSTLQHFNNGLLAAAIGSGFFLLQWLISRGRWVGGGDIRLGALMGAIVGWPNILLALFLSYITGAIVGGVLLALGRVTRKTLIPFGTFLTVATVFTMFWGDRIVLWYANIIGL